MSHHEQEEEFSLKNYFVPLTTSKAIHWIIFIGLVIYFNALFNDFVGDDHSLIAYNTQVHSLSNILNLFSNSIFINWENGGMGLTGIYYRPLLATTFSLIYSIFGGHPFIYHLFQLGIHIVNSILLLFIFQKLSLKKEIAFGLAVIFLVHPINNQAVVYISALQESLFTFFGLVGLLFVLKKRFSIYIYISIAFFLLCSLFIKEAGIFFMLIILLYQITFKQKWKILLLLNGISFLAYCAFRFLIAHIPINHESPLGLIPFLHTTLLQKLENMPSIILFYIKTFFYPADLMFGQRWVITSLTFYNFYLPLMIEIIFFSFLCLFAIFILKKRRSDIKIFCFFASWFLLGLGMHLQLIPLDFTVCERWFYFPIIGLLGMVGVGINLLNFKNKITIYLYFILLGSILFLFSIRDIVRNGDWKDNLTLYQHDIRYDMNDALLQADLATALFNSGNQKEALPHLLYSIKLHPESSTYTLLGRIYARSHKIEDAKKALNTALIYNDKYYPAYVALAEIMLMYDDPKPTIVFLKKFLSRYPKDDAALLYLAVEEYKLGNAKKALNILKSSYKVYSSSKGKEIYNGIISNKPININFIF